MTLSLLFVCGKAQLVEPEMLPDRLDRVDNGQPASTKLTLNIGNSRAEIGFSCLSVVYAVSQYSNFRLSRKQGTKNSSTIPSF